MLERFLEFAIASSIEVDASPSKVWSVMSNIDSFPEVFWNVTSVERLDGTKKGSGVKVGSLYRIHRKTREGERYYGDWTVTALGPGRSITFCSSNIVSDGMTSSSTWSVMPLEDTDDTCSTDHSAHDCSTDHSARDTGINSEDVLVTSTAGGHIDETDEEINVVEKEPSKCIATITLAIVPTKLFLIAGRIMCCCVFKKRALTVTEEDLEDLATAAKESSSDVADQG